jgi:hypothetical protein
MLLSVIPFRASRDSWPVLWRLCRHRHKTHSTNTLLVKAGVPDRIVQKIIGHLSKKMTDRYTHLDLDDMREALSKLSAKGASATPNAPMIALSVAAPASSTARKLALIYCHSTAAAIPAKEKTPAPRVMLSETGAFVGAEHRVRTGDLRLGRAMTRICKPMQRESTLWNLSRHPALPASRLCQQMQQNAARLLTRD